MNPTDKQVCIFAYGQTGSGKSWTMEGGTVSRCVRRTEVGLMETGRERRNDPKGYRYDF